MDQSPLAAPNDEGAAVAYAPLFAETHRALAHEKRAEAQKLRPLCQVVVVAYCYGLLCEVARSRTLVRSTCSILGASPTTVVVTVFCWRTRTACSHSVLSLAVIACTSYVASNLLCTYTTTYAYTAGLGLFFEEFYED
jgi:hypothetical protein